MSGTRLQKALQLDHIHPDTGSYCKTFSYYSQRRKGKKENYAAPTRADLCRDPHNHRKAKIWVSRDEPQHRLLEQPGTVTISLPPTPN